VTGLAAGSATLAALTALVVTWTAAGYSLADEPTGEPWLTVFYAAVVVTLPVALPWTVWALGALHRARLREVLGLDIPPPRRAPTDRARRAILVRLVRPWWVPATWRQLGYHLFASVGVTLGGAAVVGCWIAPVVAAGMWFTGGAGTAGAATVVAVVLFLAIPWLTGTLVRLDSAVATELLGAGRAEVMAVRLDELVRSRAEIVAATDAERRRIERDLHDGAQQRLVSLAVNLGMARAGSTGTTATGVTDVDRSDATRLRAVVAAQAAVIEQAHEEAVAALAELRQLVRGLHPAVLDDRGLDAALSGIAARAPLPVRLHVEVAPRCSSTIEAIAYFVVSEALTNVARHARATEAAVTAVRTGDRLRITVTDDGRGGAAPAAPGTSTTPDPTTGDRGSRTTGHGSGTGLRGLAQRAAGVDGTLHIDSPVGGPTTIIVELPCES
jgi:signal transduction histidine kinase